MQNEPTIPPVSEPYPVYPHDRYVLLIIVMAVLMLFIGVAQFVPSLTLDETAGPEMQLEGDIPIKLVYAYERWIGIAPEIGTEGVKAFQHQQRQAARVSYRKLVRRDPSPSNIRRLLILELPENRAAEINRLAAQTELDREELQREVAMWREIYLPNGIVSVEREETHAFRIRSLGLGWYENLALADLYERSGRTEAAANALEIAGRAAARTMTLLFLLLGVLGILGILGLVVIAWFLRMRNAGRIRPRPPINIIAPEARNLVSGYLLEVFIVYLALLIGIQMSAGGFMAVMTLALGGLDPNVLVVITTASYVVAALIAALYLAYRFRSAGLSWKTIGLKSDRPLADIGWGIAGYGASLPLLIVAGLISQLVGRYIRSDPNPVIPLFVESETAVAQLILFGLIVLAAPFFEEIFFRGVLLNSFVGKWGARLGIILSAIAFAAIHPLLGQLPILVLGYMLGVVVSYRGSLLPAIVAHAVNNGVAFTLLLVMVD